MSVRNKNTSFSTTPERFRQAKMLAALEDISLSELIDRALGKELKYLLKRHKQAQETLSLLEQDKSA